jgi:hypothetical protein
MTFVGFRRLMFEIAALESLLHAPSDDKIHLGEIN